LHKDDSFGLSEVLFFDEVAKNNGEWVIIASKYRRKLFSKRSHWILFVRKRRSIADRGWNTLRYSTKPYRPIVC